MDYKNHKISFRVWGRQALFTDPVTKSAAKNSATKYRHTKLLKALSKASIGNPR